MMIEKFLRKNMITNMEEYIKLPKEKRQHHVDISVKCIERGGNSTTCRGVLAQYLDTVIPMNRIAILAHACNNKKCSNPQHLYWATYKENIVEDGKKFGTWENLWARKVKKYGLEEACAMNNKGSQSKAGKANKGKPKSEEHKRNISKAIKKQRQERKDKCT